MCLYKDTFCCFVSVHCHNEYEMNQSRLKWGASAFIWGTESKQRLVFILGWRFPHLYVHRQVFSWSTFSLEVLREYMCLTVHYLWAALKRTPVFCLFKLSDCWNYRDFSLWCWAMHILQTPSFKGPVCFPSELREWHQPPGSHGTIHWCKHSLESVNVMPFVNVCRGWFVPWLHM